MKKKTKSKVEIDAYDFSETVPMINSDRSLRFEDLGLKLPKEEPTKVISIRLPSALLNELKAVSSQRDIPYQALMKLILATSVAKMKR